MLTPEETSNAWNAWIRSKQGEECMREGAVGEYLRNRLWWAFMAGVEAAGNSRSGGRS